MRILQLNLNHCEAAQDLLGQTMHEHKVDIALISEQFRNLDSHSWISDDMNKSAIWAMGGTALQSKMKSAKPGFTWVEMGGVYIFSCYAPPSMNIDDFERMLAVLAMEARGKHPLLIAGDFNAWSTAWGSKHTNRRGKMLLECMSLLNLVLLNVPGHCTFQTERGSSIVDLTFAQSNIARNAKWNISSIYTHSDHKAIIINIPANGKGYAHRINEVQQKTWKKQAFDSEVFNMMWQNNVSDKLMEANAERMAREIRDYLGKACDATMPRLHRRPDRRPVYWWNDKIATARNDCNHARRKLKRARGTSASEMLRTEYNTLKAALKKAIQDSKNQCFKELRESVNVDP